MWEESQTFIRFCLMPSTICSICRKNCSREPEDAIALERKKDNNWQGCGTTCLIYSCLAYLPTLASGLRKNWFRVTAQLFSWYKLSKRWEQRLRSSSQVFSLSVQAAPFSHVLYRNKWLLTNQRHKLLRKAAVGNIKKVNRGLIDQ